jgi:hypothetical protein
MRDEWTLGLIAVAAAVTPACTSQTNQNIAISAGGFAGPILDYDLALDAAMWDDTSENPIPRPLGALLDSWAAVVDPTCIPNVPFVDADQDRVPATYSATFNCVNQMSAGGRVTNVTGGVTITDGDDHSNVSGYSIAFDDFVVSVSIPGSLRSRTLTGTIAMVPVAGAYHTTRDLTVVFNQSDNPNGLSIMGTNIMSEAADFTPTPRQADPFASGDVILSGQSNLTRNFQGTTTTRTVTRTTNPILHWNGACRAADPTVPGFDSGMVSYSDNVGGSVEVTFNGGCVNPTVTNNSF